MAVETFVGSICFIAKIIIKIILEKLVFWNGLDKTQVRYENWFLQRNIGDRNIGLAHPNLRRLALVPHLPQFRVFKVRSYMSLPMA